MAQQTATVNATLARVNAVWVVLAAFLYLTTAPFAVYILLFDFFDRGWCGGKYSPLGKLSQGLINTFKWRPVPVPAAPKRFAARLGFGLCLVLALYPVFPWRLPRLILAGMLLVFSMLEAVFGLCVGCRIHRYVRGS